MLEKNKLYFGDCFDLFPQVDDKSVDMILADLPYNATRNAWDVLIPFDKLWEQYNRVIKNNGAIILFAQGIFAAKLILSNEKMYKYDLIWKKGERVSGFLDANKKPLRNHEQVLVFYKNQPTYNPQFTEGIPLHGKGHSYKTKENTNNNYSDFNQLDDTRKGKTQKFPKSVLNFERPHPPKFPTQKPVKLCEWLIKTYTNEGELVLDNVAGIGTTGKAARNTNRDWILFEKDENNYNLAVDFLKQEIIL